MKKYQVLQGTMTATGHGDLIKIERFDNLEEAQELMKKIYNDTRGYTKYPNGYLETDIAIVDEEDEFFKEMIDGMTFNY